jgi:hypothetical protein
LAESLEVVQQTAGVILAELENSFEQKAQEESETEPACESRRTRHQRSQPANVEASESLAEVA